MGEGKKKKEKIGGKVGIESVWEWKRKSGRGEFEEKNEYRAHSKIFPERED